MATLLTTYYGNTVTAGSSKQFRVVAELYSTQESSSSGYYLQVKYYVQVIVGQSSAFTKYFQVSWNSGTNYSLSTAGTYATKTVDLGWVGYGSSKTVTASGQYEGGSGTIYKSSLSGTYTVPAKSKITVQFNANGGTGAPSAVSGNAGSITLPSTVPTREGFTFMGWTARSASGYERLTGFNSAGNLIGVSVPVAWNNNSCILRAAIGRVNSTTFEVLVYAEGASSVKVPTWNAYNGQDDLVWHQLDAGSWTRGNLTYNFGAQISMANHLKAGNYNDLIDYIMHIYAYNSSGTAIVSVNVNTFFYIDVAFLPGESYPYEFNLTLYAQWQPNTMTIKYNANGGKEKSSDYYIGTDTGNIGISSSSSLEGAGALIRDIWTYNQTKSGGLYDASTLTLWKPGYTFAGWCLNADGSGVIHFDNNTELTPSEISDSILTNRTSEVILYAVWIERPTQSVYILNNGKVYARTFTTDTTTYIDKTGALHAPAFTTGTAFSLKSTGVTAVDFIEGTP